SGRSRNYPGLVDMSDATSKKNITQITCGQSHAVALSSDGLIFSWGERKDGKLGDGGNSRGSTTTPVQVKLGVILLPKPEPAFPETPAPETYSSESPAPVPSQSTDVILFGNRTSFNFLPLRFNLVRDRIQWKFRVWQTFSGEWVH